VNTESRAAVTLSDVARHAGYSRSTASLVFQESPLVAASTRDRVLAAAAELGYVYNRRAASLRMQRSNTIGLLIGGLSNPFFAELVESVEEELAPSGYTVLLGNTLDDPSRQEMLIRTLLEYRIDGLLVVPAVGATAGFAAPLDRLGVPYIVLTRHVEGLESPYVGSDDRRAGQLAAEHLVAHGCSRFAYFGGPEHVYVRRERRAGFEEIVQQSGHELDERWSVTTRTASSAGYAAAAELLRERREIPDGMVCHSDAIAFGLMRAVQDAGLRVGEDVRVIGFDDVESARNWSPSLTSISVEAREMGHEAARRLVQAIATGRPADSLIFQPSLQVRESCGEES